MVDSKFFNNFILAVILANFLLLSISLLKWVPESAQGTMLATEILFDFVFMVEAAMKIRGYGWDYYWHYSKEYYFNRLDFSLVVISIFNLVIDVLGGNFLPLDASYFRVIRYFKIFARFTRFMRAFCKLASKAIQMAMGDTENEEEARLRKAAVASKALKLATPTIEDIIYQLDGFQQLEEANDLQSILDDSEDPRWFRSDKKYSGPKQLRERDRRYSRKMFNVARSLRQGKLDPNRADQIASVLEDIAGRLIIREQDPRTAEQGAVPTAPSGKAGSGLVEDEGLQGDAPGSSEAEETLLLVNPLREGHGEGPEIELDDLKPASPGAAGRPRQGSENKELLDQHLGGEVGELSPPNRHTPGSPSIGWVSTEDHQALLAMGPNAASPGGGRGYNLNVEELKSIISPGSLIPEFEGLLPALTPAPASGLASSAGFSPAPDPDQDLSPEAIQRALRQQMEQEVMPPWANLPLYPLAPPAGDSGRTTREPLDAAIARLFPRYDLDDTGFLHDDEDFRQICVNLISGLRLQTPVAEAEAAIEQELAARNLKEEPMPEQEFVAWFASTPMGREAA